MVPTPQPPAGQPSDAASDSSSASSLGRRRFLSFAAGAAAVGAGATAAGIATAPGAAAATDSGTAARGGAGAAAGIPAQRSLTHTIKDAKHIVILMQENRSFDHYYGTLKGVRGFGDQATILLSGGNSVFNQPNGSGRQYPWAFDATQPASGATAEELSQCNGDLSHAWSDQHAAWNGGKMDSWVSAKGTSRTLGYLQRNDIPFHFALADNWTICDAYHCSILSATGPNRTYLWSGMIDPAGQAGGPAYNGGDESGLKWQTYAEALQDAGVSWKVYQNAADNFGDNGLAYFSQFTSAPAGSPLATQGMGSVPAVDGVTPDDIAAAIRADVVAGTLPQVSWVVANQGNSEHPYATPGAGAYLIDEVIQALNADPAVFNQTVLFLNYDENDGFFDHVPPPVAPAGTAGEFYDGTNIGLGFRVPMTVISPWSRGGWVNSEVFDHTSVLQFLEVWTEAIGKPAVCDNISAWRRQVCGDLTSTFDFAKPVWGLPALPATTDGPTLAECGPLPNPAPVSNALPAQEPGVRPARSLPYQPAANLTLFTNSTGGSEQVWIEMLNQGAEATKAAHFAIYANEYRSGGPWQYTVEAGGTDSDFFNCGAGYGDGLYDLTVTGPNRFLRRFRGNATTDGAGLGVTVTYDTAGGPRLTVELANSNARPATFTITHNRYKFEKPQTVTVAPGKATSKHVEVSGDTYGWYDITVTSSVDTAWSQRFTGHVENGEDSISG
jgi:phospholipase C